MITENNVRAWSIEHPWSSKMQVEQDLRLSEAIYHIFRNDYLQDELIFSGGTAFYKFYTDKEYRYSEDLDFIRVSRDGIGCVTRQLTHIGHKLGYTVSTQIKHFSKIYWKVDSLEGLRIRIKIDIDSYDKRPKLPTNVTGFTLPTLGLSDTSNVRVLGLAELLATKVRALYSRAKGRDLFDLWVGLEELNVNPRDIVDAFAHYRPETYTSRLAIMNLQNKLKNNNYLHNLDGLLSPDIVYDP
ncbi:MAG: nucleotidyl transferase AbiEii/AbiGii toxin family protein [Bifidobacteriaceae bacterium]|jgi:predicted nucleotidyltransferase component of viral defense system|nr:nucleotidyl transferase AbiEii/AbiGii toxin family protein [Bifidobacteriaceae bacterium]